MPIQVIPEQSTVGQQFGNALATGLGQGAAKLATAGIGAGLGALGTGLGRLTGLAPKRGLSKEMLSKAGFKDADIEILLSMPEKDQIKMMELILSRAPEEPQPEQAPQGAPEALTEVPQTLQENAEESRPISPAFMQDYKDITGRDFQSTLPGAQAAEKPKASVLMQPSIQEKRRREGIAREDRKLELAEEKLRLQKEQAEKTEKRELTKEERIKQHAIDKESNDYWKELQQKHKDVRKDNMRLERQRELIKKGNLAWPLLAAALETVSKGIFGFGIDLTGLLNADSQEFNKISKDYLKGAKSVFGSRLTDFDVNAYLQTVPTLSQSDEGKERVINDLQLFNDGVNAEYTAAEQIIEENGGYRPRNFEALVEKRASQILDNLADQFKKGIRGRTPEEKVPEITALKPEEVIGTKRLLPGADWKSNLTF